MSAFAEKIGTAAMMRELDRTTIERFKVPGIVLMENAGRGAFEFLMDEFEPGSVSVFCGKGNNGGDGFVIARHLLNAGVHVDVYLLARKNEVKGDARTNLNALLAMGAPVIELIDTAVLDDYRYHVADADLLVDAILGTGIQSEVKGLYAGVIRFINGLAEEDPSIGVFAVDLPSGVNADTGQIMGVAIQADATATFGMLKTGLLSFPGSALCGSLAVLDISIPAELYDDVPYSLVTDELATSLLPERAEDAHKGDLGHGVVLAGSPGKTGAAVMAAEAALRSGPGLVTLAGPAGVHSVFEAKTMEVMTEPLPETDNGTLGEVSIKRACEIMEGKTAVALGPGIGRGPEVTAFVREAIKKCGAPMVIDADGLNAVAEDPDVLDSAAGPLILTPHPGEMARLTGSSTAEVLADRLPVALEFARKHRVVVVLKGAHSLVAAPDGRAFINLTGNPGMATGGTGDVLTGVILGLLCQGLSALDAAVLGVYLHGAAGDAAAEDIGEMAMTAGDLIERLPGAFAGLGREDGDWPD